MRSSRLNTAASTVVAPIACWSHFATLTMTEPISVDRLQRECVDRFVRRQPGVGDPSRRPVYRRMSETARDPLGRSGRLRASEVERLPKELTGGWYLPARNGGPVGQLVVTMRPDELADFEERTFRQWDRASLFDLRRAIERRRKELAW